MSKLIILNIYKPIILNLLIIFCLILAKLSILFLFFVIFSSFVDPDDLMKIKINLIKQIYTSIKKFENVI